MLQKILSQQPVNKFDFMTQKDWKYLNIQYAYKIFYDNFSHDGIVWNLTNLFYKYSKEFSLQQKIKNYFERKNYRQNYFSKITAEEAWQKSIKEGIEIKQFKSLVQGDVIFELSRRHSIDFLKDNIYNYSYGNFSLKEKIGFIWAWILGKVELFLLFLATSSVFAFFFTKFYVSILNKYKPFKKLKIFLFRLFKKIKTLKFKTNSEKLSTKLKELSKLKAEGLISEEDYNNKKKQLLDNF